MKRLVILTINLALSQVTYSLDFRCGNARVQDADALKDFIALESRVYRSITLVSRSVCRAPFTAK
jgi:hypothetical protein